MWDRHAPLVRKNTNKKMINLINYIINYIILLWMYTVLSCQAPYGDNLLCIMKILDGSSNFNESSKLLAENCQYQIVNETSQNTKKQLLVNKMTCFKKGENFYDFILLFVSFI